jgi:RNA polymerase sigma-70 factor (ECF subfamily)
MEERQRTFSQSIDQHRGILYAICRSYCADRNDRDDLAQEMVAQLWRSYGRFDETRSFSTWMYRVALNVAISYRRRVRRNVQHVVFDEAAIERAVEPRSERDDDVALLRRFIEELEPLPKALMLLHLDGYSYAEIAQTLGITESNVGTKINRLKTTLRKRFDESFAGDRS